MSSESIRTCLAGSAIMGCFIDTAADDWIHIPPRLETISFFNSVLKGLIPVIGLLRPWMVPAYLDLADGID